MLSANEVAGVVRIAYQVFVILQDSAEILIVDVIGIVQVSPSGIFRPCGTTQGVIGIGHNQFGKAPHLIEVTPDKKVVWTFQDHKTMKTISSVQILDVPGDPTVGEVLH
jgi:hypothetical protein